jgi:hypothetical protein
VEAVQIFVRALMYVLEPDPEVAYCPGNGLHLCYMTEVHDTNRVVACSLICNRNLSCNKGTRLDCCDMISTIDELGMAIIALGRLYFMLSYRLAQNYVMPVRHGRRALARPQAV